MASVDVLACDMLTPSVVKNGTGTLGNWSRPKTISFQPVCSIDCCTVVNCPNLHAVAVSLSLHDTCVYTVRALAPQCFAAVPCELSSVWCAYFCACGRCACPPALPLITPQCGRVVWSLPSSCMIDVVVFCFRCPLFSSLTAHLFGMQSVASRMTKVDTVPLTPSLSDL